MNAPGVAKRRSYEEIEGQLAIGKDGLLGLLPIDLAGNDIDCIFLGGSIAEGLGNPRSDVDIYLVVESVDPFKDKDTQERIKSLRLGDRIVAPVFFSAASVRDAYQRVAAGAPLSAAEIDLLHRIRTGIPLAREQAFQDLRSQLPEADFIRLLVRNGEAMLANIFADVVGTLEGGDLPTCAFNSRLLLDCAMDACLAIQGDTLAREKWRYRKIERTLGLDNGLAQRYLALATSVRIENPDATLAYIEQCLDLYQEMETRIVADAMNPSFSPVLFPKTPATGTGPRDLGAGRLRRNPLIKMFHERDGAITLIERAPLFRLLAPYSFVWLTIDGARPQDEGVEVARALAAIGGHEADNLDRIYASCVNEWASAELLVEVAA